MEIGARGWYMEIGARGWYMEIMESKTELDLH